MSQPRWPWRLGSLCETREGRGEQARAAAGVQWGDCGIPPGPLCSLSLSFSTFFPPQCRGLPGGRTELIHFRVPVLPSESPVCWARQRWKYLKNTQYPPKNKYSEVQPQGGRGSSRGALRRPLPQPAVGSQEASPSGQKTLCQVSRAMLEFSHREMPAKGVAGRGKAV